MWQRFKLGVTRFVRHTVCIPFYLLGALSFSMGYICTLGMCGLVMGNGYEKLFVIGSAPFAISFCILASAATVLHFPFRSFILTMRDKGDKDEDMIREHFQEFKEWIGLEKKKKVV